MSLHGLTAKAVSALAAAVLATGTTAAAAAGGGLPAPAQQFISDRAAKVGVDIPSGEQGTTTTTTVTVTTTTPATIGPDAPAAGVTPSPEVCEAARAVDGAQGCSAVAKAHAPGQQRNLEAKSGNNSDKPSEASPRTGTVPKRDKQKADDD